MIEPQQVISRARQLYSDIKKRSAPNLWKKGRLMGRVRWAGEPVPFSVGQFVLWFLDTIGTQAFLCPYCQTPIDALSMTLDHKVALKNGGTNDFENLVPCCADCNNLKSTLTDYDFLLFRKLLHQLSPSAEQNILARLRAGAMGRRILAQQQAGRKHKPSFMIANDDPF